MKVLCAHEGCPRRVVWPKGWAGASIFCGEHSNEFIAALEAPQPQADRTPAAAAASPIFAREQAMLDGRWDDDPYRGANGKGAVRSPR